MAAHISTIQQYRQPIWGRMDRALRNCFTGSAILGVLLLIAIFVVPVPPPEPTTLTEIPERLARLIIKKPGPVAPAKPAPEKITIDTPEVEAPPEPVAKPRPKTPRRTSKPKASPDKGVKGRQKARQEVKQNLAQVTGSLDKVLSNLSKSLPASESTSKSKSKARRRRRVRSGRTSTQMSSVQGVSGLASADVTTSVIEAEGISISVITDQATSDGPDPGRTGGSAGTSGARSGGSEYRSNESLLSVVRRYAPGIQYCYDNELKKHPGVRGKLVISLTVLANGRVSEAIAVEDRLGSPAVTACVLSQIRSWQFPAIPVGVTHFKTPFVFTPPD